MRGLLATLALLAVAGCSSRPGSAVKMDVAPPQQSPPIDVHKVVVPKPLPDTPVKPEPAKPKSNVKELPPSQPTKLDPMVVGEYKLSLTDDQKKTLDNGLEKLREEAKSGRKGAKDQLISAEAARQLVDKLYVTLDKDGRYYADLGNGDDTGKFSMTTVGVILVSESQEGTAEGMPKQVELRFDKSTRTLVANFQGMEMVFRRKA